MRRSVRSAAALLVGALLLSGCSAFGGAAAAPIRQSVDTSAFVPSASNPDPSKKIKGITIQKYAGALHVAGDVRVAYTHTPPFGGRHDQVWAACNGVVYKKPVRSENLVHSLEHGAVWIAYNPQQISGDALGVLKSKVDGERYTVMSPYPDLDSAVSLQSWGHQLKLSDVNDPRIDEFIAALRQNQYTHPEVGASCDAIGPGGFDQDNPPPFAPPPAVGAPGAQPEVSAAAPASVAPDAAPAK